MHKRICILLFLLTILFSGQAFAQKAEIDFSAMNYVDGKVYLSSDQLTFSEKGIFILLQDIDGLLTKTWIPQVNCDENGLFVLAEHIPLPQAAWCRYGHRACDQCFGCFKPDCPTKRPCTCKRR